MTNSAKRTLVHALVLVAAGFAVGAANNLAAGTKRRLEWVKDYPDRPPRDPDGESRVEPPTPTTTAPAEAVPAADVDLTQVELPPPDASKPYVEISPEQARKLFEQGALFVDARRTDDYEAGHVRGALSIPIWETGVDEKIAQVIFEAQGDLQAPIVVYCGGGDCEDSHSVAQKLFDASHGYVLVYKDGFPNWKSRGWDVTVGGER